MATQTKKASRFEGHQWSKSETRTLYSKVNKGVKSGASKQEMFRQIAEDMKQPDITWRNIQATYYREAEKRRKAGEKVLVKLPGTSTGPKSSTGRNRPAVQKAKARLVKQAAPKPRAKAPKTVTVDITPVTPLEQLSAYVAQLEAGKAAAEKRAEQAEATAEKLRDRLARVHKLTA